MSDENDCISRLTGALARASEIHKQSPGEQQQQERGHQHQVLTINFLLLFSIIFIPIRFFTGNGAVDAGAAGLAAGLATSYFTNQIFNPCRRGGTRTNNRLGGNTGNFLLGAAVGWAGGTLINNALCNGRK